MRSLRDHAALLTMMMKTGNAFYYDPPLEYDSMGGYYDSHLSRPQAGIVAEISCEMF
jgi:hypothetical protein